MSRGRRLRASSFLGVCEPLRFASGRPSGVPFGGVPSWPSDGARDPQDVKEIHGVSFRVGRTSADLRHSLPPAPPRSHSLAQVTAISFILYPTSVPPATPIPTSRPLHTPNFDPKVTLGQVPVPEGSWDTSRPLSLLLQRLLSIPRGGSGADECPARVSVGAPAEQSRSLSGRSSTALSEHRHYHSSAAFELDHSSPPTGGPNRQDRTEVFTKSRLPGGGSSGRGGRGAGRRRRRQIPPLLAPLPLTCTRLAPGSMNAAERPSVSQDGTPT